MTDSPPPAAPAPVTWESPQTTDGPAPGIEFAPHGARLVAYIFDTLIVTAVCGLLLIVGTIVLVAGSTVQGNRVTSVDAGATAVFVVTLILAFIFGVLYFPWFWVHGGRTLGMRPFGLRVVRDQDGGSFGWGTAFLRLIGLWVAGAVFYIGYIWIFIDKRRRGWQDLIAGTVVIKQP